MEDVETRSLVRQLLEHVQVLPLELEEALLARGPEAVEPLVELLRDESLVDRWAPGRGWGPIHAARLLARLKAPEAIEPMLKWLVSPLLREEFCEALYLGLASFGPAVAPVALELLPHTEEPDARYELLFMLASCGARDERIYTTLLEELQVDPGSGAAHLARYGDARALEPLKRALEAQPVAEDEGDLDTLQAVFELEVALETLGGTQLPPRREREKGR